MGIPLSLSVESVGGDWRLGFKKKIMFSTGDHISLVNMNFRLWITTAYRLFAPAPPVVCVALFNQNLGQISRVEEDWVEIC